MTWNGAGNLPPQRSLARALVARGHTVRALAHESVRETLVRDQPMIAARVAQLGLGAVLSAEATVSEIRQAITAMLADAGTNNRATEFANSLAGHPGLDRAVELVEDLLPAER